MKKIITIIIFIFSFTATAQDDEVFNKFVIGNEIFHNKKWSFKVDGNLKFNYDRTVAWKKWGLDLGIKRKIKNWSLSTGIAYYYIINKELSNSYEFRPWLSLGLKIPILLKLDLVQQAKLDWRNISYKKDGLNDDSFGRFRYKLGLDYTLIKDREFAKSLKIKGGVEKYFIRSSKSKERYPSLREYTINLVWEFQNGHEIIFGFEYDEYFKITNTKNNGYTFILEYQL